VASTTGLGVVVVVAALLPSIWAKRLSNSAMRFSAARSLQDITNMANANTDITLVATFIGILKLFILSYFQCWHQN
jgi:hypothetical protein